MSWGSWCLLRCTCSKGREVTKHASRPRLPGQQPQWQSPLVTLLEGLERSSVVSFTCQVSSFQAEFTQHSVQPDLLVSPRASVCLIRDWKPSPSSLCLSSFRRDDHHHARIAVYFFAFPSAARLFQTLFNGQYRGHPLKPPSHLQPPRRESAHPQNQDEPHERWVLPQARTGQRCPQQAVVGPLSKVAHLGDVSKKTTLCVTGARLSADSTSSSSATTRHAYRGTPSSP